MVSHRPAVAEALCLVVVDLPARCLWGWCTGLHYDCKALRRLAADPCQFTGPRSVAQCLRVRVAMRGHHE